MIAVRLVVGVLRITILVQKALAAEQLWVELRRFILPVQLLLIVLHTLSGACFAPWCCCGEVLGPFRRLYLAATAVGSTHEDGGPEPTQGRKTRAVQFVAPVASRCRAR